MALELVTTDDLEFAAFGLLPFIRGVVDEESRVNTLLQGCLDRAMAALEDDLQTRWQVTTIKQSTTVEDDSYEIEPGQDFKRGEAMSWTAPRFVMRRRPIVSIEQIVYGLAGNRIFQVPNDWITVKKRIGVINLVPVGYSANAAVTFNSGHSPLIGPNSPFSVIPEMVKIDYTAGFYDPSASRLPDNAEQVKQGIMDQAIFYLLDRAKGIIPQSSSAGSVSQSFIGVQQQMEEAKKRVDEFKAWWNQHYRPIQMVMA